MQINYLALPHDEQKYIQGFGGETRRKKTTWKTKEQIGRYKIRS